MTMNDTKSGAVLTDAQLATLGRKLVHWWDDECPADGCVERIVMELIDLGWLPPGQGRPVVVSEEMVKIGCDAYDSNGDTFAEGIRAAIEAALSASAVGGNVRPPGTVKIEAGYEEGIRERCAGIYVRPGVMCVEGTWYAVIPAKTREEAVKESEFVAQAQTDRRVLMRAIDEASEGATGQSLPTGVQGVDAEALAKAFAHERGHDVPGRNSDYVSDMRKSVERIGLTDVSALQRELDGVRGELEREKSRADRQRDELVQELKEECDASRGLRVEVRRLEAELTSESHDRSTAEAERDEALAQLEAMRDRCFRAEAQRALWAESSESHAREARERSDELRAMKAATHDQPALHGGALTDDEVDRLYAETSHHCNHVYDKTVPWGRLFVRYIASRLTQEHTHSEHVDRLPAGSVLLGYVLTRPGDHPIRVPGSGPKRIEPVGRTVLDLVGYDEMPTKPWRLVAIPEPVVRARVVLEPAGES